MLIIRQRKRPAEYKAVIKPFSASRAVAKIEGNIILVFTPAIFIWALYSEISLKESFLFFSEKLHTIVLVLLVLAYLYKFLFGFGQVNRNE